MFAKFVSAFPLSSNTVLSQVSEGIFTGAGGSVVVVLSSDVGSNVNTANSTTFANCQAGAVLPIGIAKSISVPAGSLALYTRQWNGT